MSSSIKIEYFNLESLDGRSSDSRVVSLSLNRPESANAFNGDIIRELCLSFRSFATDQSLRALLIQGVGKHFSAGADLAWMKDSAQQSYQENVSEAQDLSDMFEALVSLTIPTIAMVRGAAYGGAVGLIAACDYAIADSSAKVCLSEARVGLIPAVIVPYLSRKIRQSDLRRLALTAKVVVADEAMRIGLFQEVLDPEEVEAYLHKEFNLLLSASPTSQSNYKKLQDKVNSMGFAQSIETVEAIASIRVSDEGQHGLSCFFEKKRPEWSLRIPEEVSLLK